MPFVKCPECGKLNSIKLKNCPKCEASLDAARASYNAKEQNITEVEQSERKPVIATPQPIAPPQNNPWAQSTQQPTVPPQNNPWAQPTQQPTMPQYNNPWTQTTQQPIEQQPTAHAAAGVTFCQACGNKLMSGAKFCGSCGNPVVNIPTRKNPYCK